MRILSIFMLAFILGVAMAGEALPKWSARIRLDGKGPSVEVRVEAKDKPSARKLILAQYKDCVFTSGPTRIREKKNEK